MRTLAPTRPAKANPLGDSLSQKRMPGWGWLEWVVIVQTLMPALMFIPALIQIRFLTRVVSFAIPLAAWGFYFMSGRKVAGGRTYPPTGPLLFIVGWMTLSIAHPTINTLNAALCAIGITVGVFCPAFWGPAAIVDRRQLRRLMVIMLLCNGASALMGIAQVYRPDTFRPPELPILKNNPDIESSLNVKTDDGREFLRPPGLTDAPGGAAIGGIASVAFGLAMALAPGAWWKRLSGMGFALAGLTVLFYSQVRSLTLTLGLGIVFWGVLLALRGEIRKLSMLLACVGLLALAALGWVIRDAGAGMLKRFGDLFEERVTTTYYKHRGAFIEYALSEYLPRYPLGAGPGRVGMASFFFGNPLAPVDRRPIYAETQVEVWILDGGLPVLIAYPLALLMAIYSAARTAVKCPDSEIAYWAGAILVYAVTVLIAAFAGQPFMSPMGVQFWALLGGLYGAQEFSRVEAAKAKLRATST
jgi:hypothetical protein